MLSLIIAYSNNNVIGVNQKLPWDNLQDDMAMFKLLTSHKVIVMGRKTFESLPFILPNRIHYVITKQNLTSNHPQVKYVKTIEEILKLAKTSEVFVIGGESIISLFAKYYTRLYLTKVDLEIEIKNQAISYFPLDSLNLDSYHKLIELTRSKNSKNCADFTFTVYERNK